jgi:hypothetical protein
MGRSRDLILAALADHNPKSLRAVVEATGLTNSSANNSLHLCWKAGLVLRTKEPIYEYERRFRGRAGISQTTRPYHLYLLRPEGEKSMSVDDRDFVKYAKKHLDARGGGKVSKAQRILGFIKKNSNQAFFSTEIAEALKDHGVKVRDVMSNVRRFEKKGLVYVRGYKQDDRQTPFRKGYIITWLDGEKPREQSIGEAIQRTNRSLADEATTSSLIERVHRIRDMIIEHSKLRKIVGFPYIYRKLGCTEYEAEHALGRALQLYPDLKEIKLFHNYRYYYHVSMADLDVQAAVTMKRNFIRMTKGRDNRVGHNWEAVAEWFMDRFTTGAKFWTQNHRDRGMDPRRITLHLLKSVGGRRWSAEVDRVWEVTPGVFAPPITYVLSCKWGLVSKKHVDDFMDVLRWSKEFGVDTPDGRQVKQGIIGVFAASAFNPKETVRLKDESTISLASYAARMEMQLLKAADFNEKLREKGCQKKVTVQKVCKIAKDEEDVRELLDALWKDSDRGEEILAEATERNEKIYRFEKMLEQRIPQ